MLYVSRAHSYYGFQWKTQAGRAHRGLFDNNDRYSEAELVLIVVFRVFFGVVFFFHEKLCAAAAAAAATLCRPGSESCPYRGR